MGFILERENTDDTPYVYIHEDKRIMSISGESYRENIVDFFEDINEWLKKFLRTDFGTFEFTCDFEYFNSSTCQVLMSMLLHMDEFSNDKNKITVNWIVPENDDVIMEFGEDVKNEMVNLVFNIKKEA